MLKKLIIHNYAIIDHIEIEFGSGLNILTGETGAGKSIIVGAIGLLLGDRIMSGALRKDAKSGYVEGNFQIDENQVELFNKSSNSIVLRREMTASGGSRYLYNGEPTTINDAKLIFGNLIDLHGQHQHQSLLDPDKYYDILDTYGKMDEPAEKVSDSFLKISELTSEKKTLLSKEKELAEKRDFLEFQLKEIISVDPSPGEEDQLEKEAKLLQNAEEIAAGTLEGYSALYDDENSAASRIRSALSVLNRLRDFIEDHESLEKDLSSALVSVEETAGILEKYSRKVEYDPARLEEINQRLSTLRHLKKKYKADISGILLKKTEIEEMLSSSENLGGKIEKLTGAIDKEKKNYAKFSLDLSAKRKTAAKKLCTGILDRLKDLGMKKSLFEVIVEPRESAGPKDNGIPVEIDDRVYSGDKKGIDEIEFLIATGKSERLLPVSQIASGGEVSRIMLGIKSVLMKADRIPVLVFDEIDTGISGRIASAVGRELANLGKYHQLLCVTHLPQIAGMSDHHFSVEKTEKDGRVVTMIRELDDMAKEYEIAKLLAGDKVSDIHLKNARELMESARSARSK
ncbi:MAG: DNA repair protein RecN [bacterium]|nr:DNA repair protein RecN [bacterium]